MGFPQARVNSRDVGPQDNGLQATITVMIFCPGLNLWSLQIFVRTQVHLSASHLRKKQLCNIFNKDLFKKIVHDKKNLRK